MTEERTSHLLLGTWRLVRWYNEAADGRITEPLGPNPVGYISYTEDGHIFAHLADPNRALFAVNDMASGTATEYQAAMKSYVSYAGTYEIEGDTVVHNVTLASFPNWTGTRQKRHIHFEDGRLRLSAPFDYAGETIVAHAIWERPEIA